MCLLIVIVGADSEYPLLVASNRDEERARPASPPGLWVGERRRVLSPRDKRAGGTWLAVNDAGMFAGLTNIAGAPPLEGARTRGVLPHLALDHDDLNAAAAAVREAVARDPFGPFRLLLSDGHRTILFLHARGVTQDQEVARQVIVLSNEHGLGELDLPGVQRALLPGLTAAERLQRLRPLLLDEGEHGGHRILKKGGDRGTVSSSLIAVHRDDPARLLWDFAPGPPDETAYRHYGNLGRRLRERGEEM